MLLCFTFSILRNNFWCNVAEKIPPFCTLYIMTCYLLQVYNQILQFYDIQHPTEKFLNGRVQTNIVCTSRNLKGAVRKLN